MTCFRKGKLKKNHKLHRIITNSVEEYIFSVLLVIAQENNSNYKLMDGQKV